MFRLTLCDKTPDPVDSCVEKRYIVMNNTSNNVMGMIRVRISGGCVDLSHCYKKNVIQKDERELI